jgi:rubrerythrin
VRVILMNGIESEALRFGHACARINRQLREPLALIRRVEQHQQTLVNWLNPPDQSPLETTLGFEQVAIEVTARVALNEPDPYLASVYRFGMLEDFDHLYRYSALYDRLEGKDPNYIIQSYSDIMPGRPTALEHRHPLDDLRRPYEARTAAALSKLNALTITAAEHQTHDFYMTIGPLFTDPVARQLYAEIASIEEQHVTQYESLSDPDESLLEKWMLHEANEVYNYYSCLQYESNPRIKEVWERFVDYELGHLHYVMELFQHLEGRDPAEVLPATLPDLIKYESHRDFVRETLDNETTLSARGTEFVPRDAEDERTVRYRQQLNADGSPSDIASAGYIWRPGTELSAEAETVPGYGRIQ